MGLSGMRYQGSGEKVHNDELNDISSSFSIVRGVKSRRMRWEMHVERMRGEKKRIRGFGGET